MNTRTPETFELLGGLLAVAVFASGLAFLLQRRRPESPGLRALAARTRSWVVLIALGGTALLAGWAAVVVLFALVSFLALREFATHALGGRGEDHAALLAAFFVVLPVQYALVALGASSLLTIWPFLLWTPLGGLVVIAAALSRDPTRFFARMTGLYLGLIACVYCVSHIPALMQLAVPGFERRAPLLMIYFVLIAQACDVLQYVWGKLLGRHPLAPAISPSKTVEGLIGGVLSATALGWVLHSITPFTPWQSAGMALTISVLGVVGGLVMSAVKRKRGIKDWSNLIPGHGGMLDRVDSLYLSAPVFYHLVRYFFASK